MRSAPSPSASRLPPLKTIRAVVEYDGTGFCGLQWQPAERSVAGELESALSVLFDGPIKITAAGRTDSGVHATGQVISFKSEKNVPIERLALALNNKLPSDLTVRDAAVVDDEFSARFSALERTYVYAVLNRPMPSAITARYAYHFYGSLDLDALNGAAQHFIGERDFRSVCGVLPESGPTIRNVKRLDARREGDFVFISIAADGFLHRMVRNIVGTLLEVGNQRRDGASIPAM
ncbi:MAG: tRNA pseudouridine(38-40) synthase TruA, partial [Candidatus Eremiobacteraeota bacterium]|nr:tRNA pseudouridine(38-40) synthase TruA [Candidatus Eremiobacteraeota bacterium]